MSTYKLDVEKVHKEHVTDPIVRMKKDIIKLLFEFK